MNEFRKHTAIEVPQVNAYRHVNALLEAVDAQVAQNIRIGAGEHLRHLLGQLRLGELQLVIGLKERLVPVILGLVGRIGRLFLCVELKKILILWHTCE